MKKLLLVVVAILIVSSISLAQLTAGKMAITTSIGPAGAIGGAYALSENMRLNAGINFNSTSVASASSTAFGIGASVWLYQPAMENVSMYYGGGFSFGSAGSPAVTSLGVTGTLGAEYWFSSRFAWGGNVNFGFTSAGPSGAKTSVFGTQGVGTTLTWWF